MESSFHKMNVFLGDFFAFRGNAANDRTCPIRVAVHLLSPITVPDCRPGPNLPNPLSPCNQPPRNRRKSRQAKLDANRTVGFEAARVHALSSPRTFSWVGYGHQAGSQRASDGRAGPGGGDEGETIRRACKNPVNPILLDRASPLALQVRMGQVRTRQVRMIWRAAFDPPSRQSRGRRIGGSKSVDQGYSPRRRRCNTR